LLVHPRRLGEIEMDVAVAEMAERDRDDSRHKLRDRRASTLDKIRHPLHRHRNIVLDRAPGMFLDFAHSMPHAPEESRLIKRGGNRRIPDDTAFEASREHLLKERPRIV